MTVSSYFSDQDQEKHKTENTGMHLPTNVLKLVSPVFL